MPFMSANFDERAVFGVSFISGFRNQLDQMIATLKQTCI
jgi:hypothetical protein